MKTCNHCGEYKKCRRNWIYDELTYRINCSEWICRDCDVALKIIEKEARIIDRAQEKKNREEWIKKRDKILKENDLYKGGK